MAWIPEPAPTRLRWPLAHLQEMIAKQFASGNELAEELDHGRKVEADVERRFELWHDRTCAVLSEAFTRPDIVNQYHLAGYKNPAEDNWIDPRPTGEELRQRLKVRLERLEAIATRFDVYAAPTDVGYPQSASSNVGAVASKVFVVHGHDSGTKETVARALQHMTGTEPVILHEQPDGGKTTIEKFELHAATASAAVVILSPDDVGGLASDDVRLQPRARQNVVYELGWFHGRLGRGRVIALLVGDVEQPSDVSGVLYIPFDVAGAWRNALGRELRNAGINADLNNLR